MSSNTLAIQQPKPILNELMDLYGPTMNVKETAGVLKISPTYVRMMMRKAANREVEDDCADWVIALFNTKSLNGRKYIFRTSVVADILNCMDGDVSTRNPH